MRTKGTEAQYWEQVARNGPRIGYPNRILAHNKKRVYLDLLKRWVVIEENHRILKTDLFAEAFCTEQFFFDIAAAKDVVGIDLSAEIVKKAKNQAGNHGRDGSRYLCCDIRQLPLEDESIDIVISDSSLDHFCSEKEITTAVKEINRVLKVGGILVLTIDNKSNLTYLPYFLIRLWMKMGLTLYFVGRSLNISQLKCTLESQGLRVVESTAIFHYPHPDRLVRWTEHLLCSLGSGRLDSTISRFLARLENLGKYRTRYLTGRYLAVKAVKVGQ